MIKLVIFDLDGVLVEAKNIHFESFNKALGEEYAIEWNEHLSIYDGLKTNQKLEMLTERKGLPISLYKKIWDDKQKYTLEALSNLQPSIQLQTCLKTLVIEGYKIACCSNSIRKTVLSTLEKLGIIQYFDLILSNEDVKNSKPYPDIYWKAMSIMSCFPEEALILEDSPYGLISASKSGANLMRIISPEFVVYENIINHIKKLVGNRLPKWTDSKMNILIPMAGAGSRFEKAGYTFPKPLIDVNGKPMIQVVVDNLNVEAHFIFICQKEHYEKYNLQSVLNLIAPNCDIIQVDGLTEGAACTTLLAKELINNDEPLLMANSDQFVEWNSNECLYAFTADTIDGGIITFESTHPKWSFAKIGKDGFVSEVAEKKPISNLATVGIYFWKHGSDYVKYAEQMITKNIRVNNEFYVCPVFNEAIQDGKKIRTKNIERMWGLGTPEDLNHYLEHHK